jgi:hypothetical protein
LADFVIGFRFRTGCGAARAGIAGANSELDELAVRLVRLACAGRADDGDLPDFFRGGSADGPGDLGFGGLEDELDLDLDGLTFGGGFDIPLTGLPEFEAAAGPASSEAAGSGPAGRAGGLDELAAITGEATDGA